MYFQQARFDGHEYVLTQVSDPDSTDVEAVLHAEYKLLTSKKSLMHMLPVMWWKLQVGCRRRAITPTSTKHDHIDFYFNFNHSILGQLESKTTLDGTPILPHAHFLATRLLPCGMFDKVTKFMGSDDIAPAADAMTKAIHAFAHFSYVYSKGFLLFCDLQGIYDNGGQMCLFDPQVHMYAILLFVTDHILIILLRNQNRSDRDAYWNGGVQKIRKFLKQHENDCERNGVCNALELRTVLVNDHSAPKEQQRSKKPTIINLIN